MMAVEEQGGGEDAEHNVAQRRAGEEARENARREAGLSRSHEKSRRKSILDLGMGSLSVAQKKLNASSVALGDIGFGD